MSHLIPISRPSAGTCLSGRGSVVVLPEKILSVANFQKHHLRGGVLSSLALLRKLNEPLKIFSVAIFQKHHLRGGVLSSLALLRKLNEFSASKTPFNPDIAVLLYEITKIQRNTHDTHQIPAPPFRQPTLPIHTHARAFSLAPKFPRTLEQASTGSALHRCIIHEPARIHKWL